MKKLKVLAIIFLLVLLTSMFVVVGSTDGISEQDKIVIHHTAAFGGELEQLKELMTTKSVF
ncbi:hypothetical protein ES705_28776 [subsurface metagenome]